jgi:NAD+ synthase (glutamine-hydrolysing)
MKDEAFFHLHRHGLVRVAAAVPSVRIADPAANARETIDLLEQAAERHAAVVVFPELGLSAYTCEDLFQQSALLDASLEALSQVVSASRRFELLAFVGVPLLHDGVLFNCAVAVSSGRVLGVVPKSYLPNYREFYELRHFAPGDVALRQGLDLLGQRDVPFGPGILFRLRDEPRLVVAAEVCEDLWVPVPPSSFAALAGATLLVNLSASNVTVAKDDYRRQLVANQSGRCLAAYAYSAAGAGESTTDLAWDGHAMVCENGTLLAESRRFSQEPQLVVTEVDVERLAQDRLRQNSFAQSMRRHRAALERFQTVDVDVKLPRQGTLLPERRWERFPYLPSNPVRRSERCEEVYQIQVHGLVQRMKAIGTERLVIGISGGLDSTQALLVAARATDLIGLPRTRILGVCMPGFATSQRTLRQSRELIAALGCTPLEIDIGPSCRQMLEDIGHPFASGEPVYDVTFENVQAGERTSHLFRLANQHRGIVVGTSDLSEIALGWCTYGVGDHMAHYHVNASVPKTLVADLVRWVAARKELGEAASDVLERIVATEISPELVPGEGAEPAQRTEELIGPYALHDFFLYHVLRFGFSPEKVAFLAWCTWHDASAGDWPEVSERAEYGIGEIKKWLGVFLKRFFETSQFKRSAIPNAPKVGSGGSLSPRGDWRAPSDSGAATWLESLARVPDKEP